MWISVLGIAFGLMVSGGVFTALLALGLVPRFAGKTHTANHILTYESAVVWGCIFGGILSGFPIPELFEDYVYGLQWFQGVWWPEIAKGIIGSSGFFAGCFVGCVALAIAEMLDSIPIFARRIGFVKGLGAAVLAVSVGKTVGSLIYFAFHIGEM